MLRGDEVYGPKNSLNDYFVNFTVYLWLLSTPLPQQKVVNFLHGNRDQKYYNFCFDNFSLQALFLTLRVRSRIKSAILTPLPLHSSDVFAKCGWANCVKD